MEQRTSEPTRYGIQLSPKDFDARVAEASRDAVVIVFFWAPWCRLCRQAIPVVADLIEAEEGKAVLALADVRQLRQKGRELGMRGLPSLFAFREGQQVDRILGSPPLDLFTDWLRRLVE